MPTLSQPYVRWLLALALGTIPLLSSAQMAQQPLLTRSAAVEPNLVFMFDDSGSMDRKYVYQYGGSGDGYGMHGPDGDCDQTESNLCYKSPDVNRLYYDPRITYKLRVDASGNSIDTSTLSSDSTEFYVYFYKKTASSTKASVWDNTGNNGKTSSSYFTTSYQPSAAELKAGASTTTPYPNRARVNTSSYPKFIGRTDCVSSATVCTWSEELRNYSIWKAYHSTRDAMAKTGIGLAFKSIGPTIRIGWGRINTLDGGTLDAGVSLFNTATKSAFYTWLYGISINGSTPNRLALDKVGKYFSRSDSDGPWGTTPSSSSKGVTTVASPTSSELSSNHYSCRRSFAMLMTDGYYNDSGPSPSVGNADKTKSLLIKDPSGKTYQYDPAAPNLVYPDNASNTLADIAMKYWYTDLRTDLANSVPSNTTNESFWQNMSFYAIGLGIYGTLAQTSTTLNNIKNKTTSWPSPSTNDPTTIDDMWHATINGRGSLLTATDSDSLNSGIDTMMSSINKLTSTQSGVAVSTASLKTGTRKYTPQYTTGVWSGNVIARELDPNTGNETSTAWQVQGQDGAGNTYNGIPAAATRSVFVGNAATSGTRAVPFTYSSLTSAGLIGDMPASARTTSMVDYLRGDATNEGDSGIYRTRENRLGDIVNSSPVFIKGTPGRELSVPASANSPYVMEVAATTNALPGTGSVYTSYLSTLAARNEGVMLVGANDGMLHAFRDGTPTTPTLGGVETFAYVPRTALANMHKLSDPFYSHQYFVDGPNIESDAYLGSIWKQVVVGTTGAGGKSVYALDVTNPLALDASKVLWEINPSVTGYANIGHVLSDVQTGALQNNTWAALLGNGYESASGIASLMVVDLQTGALIRELQTPSSSGGPWSATVASVTTTYKNGLSGVRLVRDSAEQRVIGAYAGDLRGNVWRFDLSSTAPSSWTVSLLFSTGSVTPDASAPTGYPKPVTATPQTVKHPVSGRMVSFGTGKFYEDKDVPSPYATQSIYGVWDKTDFGSTYPVTGYPVSASTLVTRVISAVPGFSTALQITNPDGTVPGFIDWTSKYGWYVDLPNAGQRLVYPVDKLSNRNSRVLSFGTISPSNVSLDVCNQAGTGTGWDFFLDGLYGGDPGRPPELDASLWMSILDTNGDGTLSSTDAYSIGTQGKADGRNTTIKIESKSSSTQTTFATLSGGSGSSLVTTFNCVVLGNCVNSSVTPKTIKTREWRQLFLR